MEDPSTKEEPPRVRNVLEALKQASHDLQASSDDSNSSAIKALLELETESENILSKDPHLSTLSQHLSSLKTLVQTLQRSRGHSLKNFLTRRVSTHSISRVAGSIETEIQAWIDRESIENLTEALKDPSNNNNDEDELVKLLTQFEGRVLQGFNHELQDLLLKAKDVFVGQVLMGQTIKALITIGSSHSFKVLSALIKSIKSPLVDEIESNGEIPKIISFLDVKDLQMKMVAMDCILEIGYFGRKDAIEAMLEQGLVNKLVELQRSELGGDLIEIERLNEEEEEEEKENDSVGGVMETKRESRQRRFLESHPFASCVARFAVQLEVGEGLRQREKRAFKQEIIMKVREASVSDAEVSTIVAEVLWGSSP
ncbi:hypothetical protein LWI29_032735 [Acer saccharum]|uniref:Uncharacterized protein n=1 Tax=Acer saccharum TaxID=4024 RepID=A0AA39VA07_ACESA|nr:hypothetical protein LWI29_032735 [Acer saccharum]